MHEFKESSLTHDRHGNPFVGVRVAPPSREIYVADYRAGWYLAASGLPKSHCTTPAMVRGWVLSKRARKAMRRADEALKAAE